MNNKAPHIVQYQGSKRLLAPRILQYMPLRFNRLIEPFAGMAAISIATAQQKRAHSYLLNDLNKPLIDILKSAIEEPERLVTEYKQIWNNQFSFSEGSIAHFYKMRDTFNQGNQNAATMLYLLARCVKGSVRYSGKGHFNQSPDKRRHGTNPSTLARNLYHLSPLLKGRTTYHTTDYREILDMARVGDIVYMDPPYQGVCSCRDNRYIAGILFEEFVVAIDTLNSRGIDFIISYDGFRGTQHYGQELPSELNLSKFMISAGVSTQSTLLGQHDMTFEALYLSSGLSHNQSKVCI